MTSLTAGELFTAHKFICHAVEQSVNDVLVTLREDEAFQGATDDGGFIRLTTVQELSRGANGGDRYAIVTTPLTITRFTPSTIRLGSGVRDLEYGQPVYLRVEVYNLIANPTTPSWGRIAELNGTLLFEDTQRTTEDYLNTLIDS